MHGLVKSNAARKANILRGFMRKDDHVLDFGCGDFSLARELRILMPGLDICGVDVVDFGIRDEHISFQQYDGEVLPYNAGSFDTVIVYHVLHHTKNPTGLLAECFRVSKRAVLLVEPVYRSRWEILGMSCLDWLFNIWKDKSIAMTFAFRSQRQWEDTIRRAGWHLGQIIDVEILPKWFPTGRSMLFVCTKSKTTPSAR